MIKMIVINVTKCLENDSNDTYSLFSVLYFEGLNGSAIYIRTYVLFIFIRMCRKRSYVLIPMFYIILVKRDVIKLFQWVFTWYSDVVIGQISMYNYHSKKYEIGFFNWYWQLMLPKTNVICSKRNVKIDIRGSVHFCTKLFTKETAAYFFMP